MATSAKFPLRQKKKTKTAAVNLLMCKTVLYMKKKKKKKKKNFTQSWLLCLYLSFMNAQLPPTQKHTDSAS